MRFSVLVSRRASLYFSFSLTFWRVNFQWMAVLAWLVRWFHASACCVRCPRFPRAMLSLYVVCSRIRTSERVGVGPLSFINRVRRIDKADMAKSLRKEWKRTRSSIRSHRPIYCASNNEVKESVFALDIRVQRNWKCPLPALQTTLSPPPSNLHVEYTHRMPVATMSTTLEGHGTRRARCVASHCGSNSI